MQEEGREQREGEGEGERAHSASGSASGVRLQHSVMTDMDIISA